MAFRAYFDTSHRAALEGLDLFLRETLKPAIAQMRATLAEMNGGAPPAEGQIVYFEQGPGETYSATLRDAVGRGSSVVTSIDRDAGVITLNGEPIEADRAAGAKILSGVRPEVLRRKSGLELAFEEAASKGLASARAQEWQSWIRERLARPGIEPIGRAVNEGTGGFVEASDARG